MTTGTASRGRVIHWEDIRLPAWVTGVMGAVGVVLLWWVLSGVLIAPTGAQIIPSPLAVIVSFGESGWDFYVRNFTVTLQEAGIGYLWGNGLALVIAGLVLVVPRLEPLAIQLAILTYCVPIIAIGFLVVIVVTPAAAGEPAGTPVFLAALSCFFTTVVGALLGLKSADQAQLDVVTVYGGSAFTQLRKVRVIAALPAILNALQIAVPAAFLGAVLGEFFGRVQGGVGLAMILAQQNSDAPLVWALSLASGAVALAGFLLLGLVARAVAPWSKGVAS